MPPRARTVGIPAASSDGRYYARYPAGDRPANTALAGVAASADSASANITSAIKMAAAAAAQASATANLSAGSTILFQDDFKTGYTWGALPVLFSGINSNSTFHSDARWGYVDTGNAGQMAIVAYPPDAAKNAFRQQYILSDDADVIGHAFDPLHVNRPLEVYVKWTEYRSGQFDHGPSKDFRIGMFQAGEWPNHYPGGGNGFTQWADIYGGVGGVNGGSAGYNPVVNVGVNGQAASPTDFILNYAVPAGFTTRAVEHTYQFRFKVNSPGNADGITQIWVDDVLVASNMATRFTPSSWSQAYIDFWQFGMSASNNNIPFVNPDGSTPVTQNFIYRTDLKIRDSFIP